MKATEVGPITAHDGRRRDRCAAGAASTVLVRGRRQPEQRQARRSSPLLKIVEPATDPGPSSRKGRGRSSRCAAPANNVVRLASAPGSRHPFHRAGFQSRGSPASSSTLSPPAVRSVCPALRRPRGGPRAAGRHERQHGRAADRCWAPCDAALPRYRLHVLNAQPGILPTATASSPRRRSSGRGAAHPRLSYVPAGSRSCRGCSRPRSRRTSWSLHTTRPARPGVARHRGQRAARRRSRRCAHAAALVVAQLNPPMPCTFGDAEIAIDAGRPRASRSTNRWRPTRRPRRTTTPRRSVRASRARVAGRRDAAGRIGAVPDAAARRACRAPRPAGVDRDVQRRRPRPGPRRRARPGRPLTRLVRVRLPRALRVGRPQPAGADAAHGDDQRARPDRAPAGDDVDQHRPAGRPVRPGQRLPDRRADLLRLRRPDRLRRRARCTARRPGRSSPCGRGTRGRPARRSCRSSTSR